MGIKSVFVHKYGGILSAYGIALADVVHEAQEPCGKSYAPGRRYAPVLISIGMAVD